MRRKKINDIFKRLITVKRKIELLHIHNPLFIIYLQFLKNEDLIWIFIIFLRSNLIIGKNKNYSSLDIFIPRTSRICVIMIKRLIYFLYEYDKIHFKFYLCKTLI